MNAWMSFAKDMGDTTGDFVKRFGEAQQKNYEKWVATMQDGTKTGPSLEDVKEVGERFRQWTGLAQEIGQKVKESFTTGSDLQKEFFSAWSQASQSGASPGDAAKGFSNLAQKFWTQLASNLNQKSLTSLRPEFHPDEFMRSQQQMHEEISETIKKLSPPFVALFGQALNSTLEIQNLLAENYWTGLRLLTNVGEEATAMAERLLKMAPSWGQAP
jgi:hypothetical protein